MVWGAGKGPQDVVKECPRVTKTVETKFSGGDFLVAMWVLGKLMMTEKRGTYR